MVTHKERTRNAELFVAHRSVDVCIFPLNAILIGDLIQETIVPARAIGLMSGET